ncbi:unnamed protein product [Rotaria socialis]|uniref:Uncharacterized protein n=2 Tax=Rotaria socialis TaxID=392032 RepID=A0A817TDB1_9BILA|nr:unnamed protein product [Rotaria socialis]
MPKGKMSKKLYWHETLSVNILENYLSQASSTSTTQQQSTGISDVVNQMDHHDFILNTLNEWCEKNLKLNNKTLIENEDFKLLLTQGASEGVCIICSYQVKFHLTRVRHHFSLNKHINISIHVTFKGEKFFELIQQKCGQAFKELMEILSINTVYKLLLVEDDILPVFQKKYRELEKVTQRACLHLDDGTIMLKPSLRMDFDRFIRSLHDINDKQKEQKEIVKKTEDIISLFKNLVKSYQFNESVDTQQSPKQATSSRPAGLSAFYS